MKGFLATTCLVTGVLLTSGCATKKYVRNTTAPVQAKVDQVGEQANRNTQSIEDTRNQVKQVDERAQSGISAAQERAATADQHAAQADQHAATADQHAQQAAQSADQANRGVENLRENLRQVVSNLDDYKLQSSASVLFKFNQYNLSDEAKQELDKLVADIKPDKRYFIAVEGFTDDVGTKAYNEALSRRRADAVVQYLVAQHDLPIYRIHMVGLGEEKPVDTARNRAARAKNRRVEVKVFSADQAIASVNNPSDNSASRTSAPPNQ